MNKNEFLQIMLDVNKQIYESKSWKRRNDLKKYLKRLEGEWYKREREGG